MMIVCERHGEAGKFSEGIQTSPDVERAIEEGGRIPETTLVVYEYEGMIAEELALSLGFAEAHGLRRTRRLPLPETYPDWYAELRVCCRKCVLAGRSS